MFFKRGFLVIAFMLAIALGGAEAHAQEYVLTLQDHTFSPNPIEIPAHQKIKLTVKNLQNTPTEFESSDLDREKVVGANSEIIVLLGPLDAGKYIYFDDFHRQTTGTIVVK